MRYDLLIPRIERVCQDKSRLDVQVRSKKLGKFDIPIQTRIYYLCGWSIVNLYAYDAG
jgi:hypothetical protein